VLSYSLHDAIKCLRQNSLVLENFSGMLPQVMIDVMRHPKWYRLLNMAFLLRLSTLLNQVLRQWVVILRKKEAARSEWRHCTTSQSQPRRTQTRQMAWFATQTAWYPTCKNDVPYCIVSQVACLALPYISTLSYKRHDFRHCTENKMCVIHFIYNFAWNISLCKKSVARYYHKCAYVFM
jgi:hypothetical protein